MATDKRRRLAQSECEQAAKEASAPLNEKCKWESVCVRVWVDIRDAGDETADRRLTDALM